MPSALCHLPFATSASQSGALPEPLCEHAHNRLAVEAPVFDEDVRGISAADSPAREKDSGHVCLERLRIELRRHRLAVQTNAGTPVQIAVRVISRQQKDGIGWNIFLGAV